MGGTDGNLGSFSGLSKEQAQDACCQSLECAGFGFSGGSGYYKKNQDCGKVQNSGYIGYTKPSQMPSKPTGPADITMNFADVGFSATQSVEVYNIWAQKSLGSFKGSFTAKSVGIHDSAFLRLSKSSAAVLV